MDNKIRERKLGQNNKNNWDTCSCWLGCKLWGRNERGELPLQLLTKVRKLQTTNCLQLPAIKYQTGICLQDTLTGSLLYFRMRREFQHSWFIFPAITFITEQWRQTALLHLLSRQSALRPLKWRNITSCSVISNSRKLLLFQRQLRYEKWSKKRKEKTR